MLIALILGPKAALTHATPRVLLGRLQVLLQLARRPKSQETCQADKLVADAVVVLKVVLEAPRVLEGRETKIAVCLVAGRVVDVVLEAVSVLEYTLA